jgi:hypothetical protein
MKTSFGLSKNIYLTLVAAAWLLLPQIAQAMATAQQIQGEVLVQKKGVDTWTAVTTDTALDNGDSLKTRKGSCTLTYGDQATFVLQENTSVTVDEKEASQDISLITGKILGKVNHQTAVKPFQVVTPSAIAAVRGTEVDFAYDDQGQFAVDLHNGKIHVFNDSAEFSADLDGGKKIKIKFDKESNTIHVLNDCGSNGSVSFSILGAQYAENPCEEKTVDISTANPAPPPVPTPAPDKGENVDEGREAASTS